MIITINFIIHIVIIPLQHHYSLSQSISPVEGLLGLPAVLGIALQAAVDDVDGGPEPGLDPVPTVLTEIMEENNIL